MTLAQPHQNAVVHVLYAGFPLCGFSMDPPSHWPRNHSWVNELDREVAPEQHRCERCFREAER